MKDKRESIMRISLPRASTSDLRGKQSVRATFKLTEECIGAISIVAAHLGIKQKSLFDHLVEDIQSLNSIARELRNAKLRHQDRVQKTFVISRKSLFSLDEVSKNYNAPRDALVEYSVQRLLPIIIKEQKKHASRKKLFRELEAHFKTGQSILHKLYRTLGDEDPLYDKMLSLMLNYQNTFSSIESFIERGKIIEEFDPEMLRRILLTSRE
jgi:hypothetical protein